MSDADNLTPADPSDLAAAIAFALRFQGRKRVHNADEIMAEIVAKRLVEHLERSGFVVIKKPPISGAAALGCIGGEGRPLTAAYRQRRLCHAENAGGRKRRGCALPRAGLLHWKAPHRAPANHIMIRAGAL